MSSDDDDARERGEPGEAEPIGASSEAARGDERRRLAECRDYATALSWVQREVYEGVLSFGPFLGALPGGSDEALAALQRGYGALAELRAALRELRSRYLEAQREQLGERLSAEGLRLHLGARAAERPGWLTIDLEDADLRWNVTWGLPLRAGQCEYVYSSHMLEHLYAPDQTTALLREVHRVLRPGGVLRLVVPDMARHVRAYVDGDAEFFALAADEYSHYQRSMTPLIRVLEWAGHNARDDCFLAHKTGFDLETLRQTLTRAGFTTIERAAPGVSAHPGLCLDPPHVVAAGASLFVEATR